MKKQLFGIAAAVALLFLGGCVKEMENPNDGRVKVSIGASIELPDCDTKSLLSDLGVFSWSATDKIELRSGSGFSQLELTSGAGTGQATFTGWVTGAIGHVAVFPSFEESWPSLSGNTLTVRLPAEIEWVAGQANNWQVGISETSSFQFSNIAALFKVTLCNLPAASRKVTFKTGKRITGAFTLDITDSKPYIEAGGETTDGVTFTFTESQLNTTEMVFYVPVPVGSYSGFAFDVKDESDEVLASFKGRTAQVLTRGKLRIMPALTLATVNGGGDNGTLNVVVPEGYSSGTFVLPNTTSDVEVHVEANPTNDITLTYYDESDAIGRPQNVFILIEGNVKSLTIDLPQSHVELNGTTTGTNVFTINDVTSTTSLSTLVIGNSNANIKIGKDDDANTGLTVKGGSLQLQTVPVKKLTVDIPETQINTTEERVNISIASDIEDLVVTSAATQDFPDKVFVTLESGSSVTNAITVPEVNCNLYIAPGATAEIVETSAAENTISGNVTTLTAQQQEETSTVSVTVNGTVANLAATGEGTTVVVEEGATVSTSLSSTYNAVVVVVVDESTTAVATIPEIQTTDTGGAIVESEGQAVAMIGSTTYSTLAAAVAAVTNGQTITLLSDVTLAETLVVSLEDKVVTLDLGGKTLTGRTNLTSGNLTLQNGNVVNTDGQPLNVYGSDTQGAQNYSVLSVARDVTVTGKYGVCVFGKTAQTNGYGAVVNVEGKLIANNGIFVSGNLGNNVAADMNNIVNISGTLTSESDVAVALNGWATVNVQSGAKITGNTGIAVKRGVLNVYDGATVTGNGQWVTPPAANNSGTEPTGAAVSMTSTYNQYGAMAVNIAGGSFTSVNGEALYKANQTYANAAEFIVTGGSFSSDPTVFVHEGLQAVENGNVWTIQNTSYKASIGNTLYETLDAAIAAALEANNNATITILDNIVCTHGFDLDKSVTIDLNGKTVSFEGVVGNGREYVATGFTQSRAFKITGSADFTLKNGTVALNEALLGSVRFSSTGNLLLENYTTNNSRGWGLNIKLEKGTAVLKNVTINSTVGGGVEVNGPATATMTDCVINQTGKDSEPWISAAVSVAYGGHLTVNSGSYSALYASYIYTSGGTLDILGGTFTGRVDGSLGAAVMIQKDNANYPEPNAIVNINKGTFNGKLEADNPNCALNISGGTFNKGDFSQLIDIKPVASASITGGTFDSDPSAYVAPNYEARHTGNVWKVGLVSGVASIGNTGYATLAEAIAAVQNGQTITLLNNASLASIDCLNPTQKGFTISGENKTIDASAATISYPMWFESGDFTIENVTISSSNPNKTQQYLFGIEGNTSVLNNVTLNSVAQTAFCAQGGSVTLNNVTITNTGENNKYEHNAAINTALGGEIIINSGTYSASSDGCVLRHYSSGGRIIVKDGTFSGKIYAMHDGSSYGQYESLIRIEGGTFTNVSFEVVNSNNGNAQIVITGGTFDHDPSAYVADGYSAIQNGNVWTVEAAVASVAGVYYSSLEAAVAAVTTTNKTIELLRDVEVDNTIIIGAVSSTQLNLNGHSISKSDNFAQDTEVIQTINSIKIYGSGTEGDWITGGISATKSTLYVDGLTIDVVNCDPATSGTGGYIQQKSGTTGFNAVYIGQVNIRRDRAYVASNSKSNASNGITVGVLDVAEGLELSSSFAYVTVNDALVLHENSKFTVGKNCLSCNVSIVGDGVIITEHVSQKAVFTINYNNHNLARYTAVTDNTIYNPINIKTEQLEIGSYYGWTDVTLEHRPFINIVDNCANEIKSLYEDITLYIPAQCNYTGTIASDSYPVVNLKNVSGPWSVHQSTTANADYSFATLKEAYDYMNVAYLAPDKPVIRCEQNIDNEVCAYFGNIDTYTTTQSSTPLEYSVDLNGHTVRYSGPADANATGYFIYLKGNVTDAYRRTLTLTGTGNLVYTGNHSNNCVINVNTGNLIVDGNITMSGDHLQMAVWNGSSQGNTIGNSIINAGSFEVKGSQAIYSERGTVTINGGAFSSSDTQYLDASGNHSFLLNCLDSGYQANQANFLVTGGSFVKFNPANCASEGVGTNFVADGYASTQDGNVWTVAEASAAEYTFAEFNAAVIAAGGTWTAPAVVTLHESARNFKSNDDKAANFYLGQQTYNVPISVQTLNISNVTFQYDADDSSVNLVGEIQAMARNITFSNCIFNEVSACAYGYGENWNNIYPDSYVVEGCTFNNVQVRYAIHQTRSSSLTVLNNTFQNVERGINVQKLGAGDTPSLTIKNNTFTGISSSKGVLCLDVGTTPNFATPGIQIDVTGNTATGQTFLRLTSADTVTLAQANAILEGNTYGTAYAEKIPTE